MTHARLALLALALIALTATAAVRFPALSGRVVDEAGLLPPPARAALSDRLAAYEQQTGIQLVVATLKSLQGQEIEEYGIALARQWGIGQKEDDNGVLLIVAPNERAVRIEVGYGLEGTLTDALTSVIVREDILPAFREGDYARGITQGAEAIMRAAADPATARARTAKQAPSLRWLLLLILPFVIAIILSNMFGGGPPTRGYRHSGWGIPGGFGGGGGFGGRGGFGGGFGGGGGGFGGGGASGRW